MAETIAAVGAILDALILIFILHMAKKSENRTWNQKLGVIFASWYLLNHLVYQALVALYNHGLPDAPESIATIHGYIEWNLWRIAMLAILLACLTIPMPLFRKASTYWALLGAFLVLNLAEVWMVQGPPSQSYPYWGLWFAMSYEAIFMMTLTAYFGWVYFTTDKGDDDSQIGRMRELAGIFGILVTLLWAGKGIFDWPGLFLEYPMVYSWWPGYGAPHDYITHLSWTGEILTGYFAILILSLGGIIHMARNGPSAMPIFLLALVGLGICRHLIFGVESINYAEHATVYNEESVKELFALLTHGTMQSLARPILILLLAVKFEWIDLDADPKLSRGIMLVTLTAAASTMTEIIQPIIPTGQLLTGAAFGAIFLLELEKKVINWITPNEADKLPEWDLEGDTSKFSTWTNYSFLIFFILSSGMLWALDKGVIG